VFSPHTNGSKNFYKLVSDFDRRTGKCKHPWFARFFATNGAGDVFCDLVIATDFAGGL
jgi:hypothetical protein